MLLWDATVPVQTAVLNPSYHAEAAGMGGKAYAHGNPDAVLNRESNVSV